MLRGFSPRNHVYDRISIFKTFSNFLSSCVRPFILLTIIQCFFGCPTPPSVCFYQLLIQYGKVDHSVANLYCASSDVWKIIPAIALQCLFNLVRLIPDNPPTFFVMYNELRRSKKPLTDLLVSGILIH